MLPAIFYLQFLNKFYVTDLHNEKTIALKIVILLNHLWKAMKMVDRNIIFLQQLIFWQFSYDCSGKEDRNK